MLSEKFSGFSQDSEARTVSCFSFSNLLSSLILPDTGYFQLGSSDDDEIDSNEPLPDLPYRENPLSIDSAIKADPVLASMPWVSRSASDKLTELRHLMKKNGIAVYIVPLEDEHYLEYTGLSDRRREFISGFTGSAGVAVVTLDDPDSLSGEAALLTDGRYFLQAEKEMDSRYWKLLKQGVAGYPSWKEFAMEKAISSKFSNVISVDPKLISLNDGDYFNRMKYLKYQSKFEFKPLLEPNLVDEVWGPEKPKRPLQKVYHLSPEFSGETTNAKLKRVREYMGLNSFYIISALEDIAWLFNLRADEEIPFNPFFFAYSVITNESVTLYIDKRKIENLTFEIDDLVIKDYSEFYSDLRTIRCDTLGTSVNQVIFPNKSSTSYAIFNEIPQSAAKSNARYESIVSEIKKIKNKKELFNAKVTQYKDSLAFIKYLAWLEFELLEKKRTDLTEYEAACKIYAIRKSFPNFKGLSYATILSTGPNAAIIHYSPTKEENAIIDPKTPYLVDSGAHYLEGTTDITRTYMFGHYAYLNQNYRKWYTLVLKGHMAVATCKFPPKLASTGAALDAFARQPMWNEGLDFAHGTGHGVGSFGNVHESPLYIAPIARADLFVPGEILTVEPGLYFNGKCGFRVESELEIVECDADQGKTRTGDNFLKFNYLTKVPVCRGLIDRQYLLPAEIRWINEYHQNIFDEFSGKLLELGDKKTYRWLAKETAAI